MKDLKEYFKEYREKNKEKINKSNRQWYLKNKENRKEYSKKYYQEHKEYINKYSKKWKSENKEKTKLYLKKSRDKRRITILNIISNNNPHCVRCGCNDIRLLEINHKNGGGRQENQGGIKSDDFYRHIYQGIRKTDDLEILCKICNAWHYLELKYGELPYKIFYKKGRKIDEDYLK